MAKVWRIRAAYAAEKSMYQRTRCVLLSKPTSKAYDCAGLTRLALAELT